MQVLFSNGAKKLLYCIKVSIYLTSPEFSGLIHVKHKCTKFYSFGQNSVSDCLFSVKREQKKLDNFSMVSNTMAHLINRGNVQIPKN